MNRLSYTWSADGNSDIYSARIARNQDQVEKAGVTLGGTWDSGSVTMLLSVDAGSSFEPVEASPGTGASWSDDTAFYAEVPAGSQFYFALAGSSSPDLDLSVSGNIRTV
jgi:hypothetical protein